MNRIEAAASRYLVKMQAMDLSQLDKLEADSELSPQEYTTYQQLQSRAYLKQLITFEESETLFKALSNWDEQPLEMKVAVTLGLGQLARAMGYGN